MLNTKWGCRSFLTPDKTGNGYDNIARALDYEPGKPKYYGRFNLGVVSINLADVALSSGGDFDKFWELMEERMELIHEVHKIRINRISKAKARVAPILWCDGAFARLDPDDTLDKIVHGGYCTISTGYAALFECTKIMTGESMHLEMDLSDDVALAGYMVEVHNNFDHHGHKAPARAAEDSVAFYFKQSYEISGRNQHIHSHDVVIPANAKAGDYHLMVYCTDAAGNQSYVARNIVLSPDAEHHHHDDE